MTRDSSMEAELKEIAELKELLLDLGSKLVEKEHVIVSLLGDTKRWDELARVISDLRMLVRDLKTTTETLVSKAESLIDEVNLKNILAEMIDLQNQNLRAYLDKANVSVTKVGTELHGGMKEIITINHGLIQKLSSYLGSVATNRRSEVDLNKKFEKLYLVIGVGFLVNLFLVPLIVFITSPPLSYQHRKTLDVLYERLFHQRQLQPTPQNTPKG